MVLSETRPSRGWAFFCRPSGTRIIDKGAVAARLKPCPFKTGRALDAGLKARSTRSGETAGKASLKRYSTRYGGAPPMRKVVLQPIGLVEAPAFMRGDKSRPGKAL